MRRKGRPAQPLGGMVRTVSRGGRELPGVPGEVAQHLLRQDVAGLYRATPEGEVLDCNDAFARLLGWPDRAAFLGSGAAGPWDPAERAAAVGRLREASRPGREELRLRRRDGKPAWVQASEWLAVDEGGAEVILGVAVDVTDRREMEARLLQAERLASVGTLAAGVAHEVNNPLSYVIANLGYAQEQVAAAVEGCRARSAATEAAELAQAAEAIVEARQGAERVRSIVRDLRMYARAEDQRSTPLDMASVLDSALAVLRAELSRRTRVVRSFQPSPPVLGSAGRLGQVFLNLLLNALQALPDRDPDANEIRVTVAPAQPGRVLVEVADNGAGMGADVLARAFEPFFTTKAGPATGLGLAVSRSIVEAVGGEIRLEAEAGVGTRARVLLPAADPRPAAAIRPEAEPAEPAASPAGRRVLVVDDDPVVGQAVKRLLRGCDVTVLSDSRAALGLVAGGATFDAILCDLFMPGIDGMAFHRGLRERDPEAAARIIFITAGAFTDEASEFLESVPNERLEKPFDAARLRALVARKPPRG